jgi:diadenosine tetraphosphate (Ap4A) HIT family hydrolase
MDKEPSRNRTDQSMRVGGKMINSMVKDVIRGQMVQSIRVNMSTVINREKVVTSHFHIHILGTYNYSNESTYTGSWVNDNMQGYVTHHSLLH